MTLEAVIQKKDQIPEGLAEHYVEADGVFVLDVPGMKTQKDFDNYAEALKKRFTDAATDVGKSNRAGLSRDDVVDVVEKALKKFSEAGGAGGANDDNKGKGGGNGGDPQVAQRLHDMERDLASAQEKLGTLQKERDDALTSSRGTKIRNRLVTSAGKANAKAEGIDNLVSLVETDFEETQDGNIVTKLESKSGVSPNQSPDDYFAALARKPEFRMFWPASTGAGADGEGSGGPGSGADLGKTNPWTKAGWNLTNQGTLVRTNRAEAERLMKAAGVELGATDPVR